MIKNLIRFFLATILLSTAIGKLLDIQGFAEVIQTFKIMPIWATAPMGLALSLFELGLSIWLFTGIKLRFAALTSAILHSTFIAWLLLAIARGLEIQNCGCYGIFFARPLDHITILEDVFLVLISLILYFQIRKSRK